MNRELEKICTEIVQGGGSPLLLLFGDDLEVEQARKAIIDLLVEPSNRAFNLERFDGRSTPWGQIEAALDTPPLLSGRKLVWVEKAPYFFSREQNRELAESVVECWLEGKRDDAAKLLIELLCLEGWTEGQWEKADSGSLGPLLQLFDGLDREEIEQLLGHCKSSGLSPGASRSSEGSGLLRLIEKGLPPWAFLLITAEQVDRRTRLYKRLDELGAARSLGPKRERDGRIGRDALGAFVGERIRQAGKTIDLEAREAILRRAGDDLRAVQHELDKLVLHAGDAPAIRRGDVEAVFTDRGEGWVFDLTRALADGDAVAALSGLARLLGQGEHPLKLLATIAAEARKLLAARQLLEGELRGRWKPGMTYAQFEQRVLAGRPALITRNAYGDFFCFQRAERFAVEALRFFLEEIADADLRIKSSGNPPRLVMETLILRICLRTQRTVASMPRAGA
ncbi:MAG TPA: DNA polymerase III subunit delta [Candidatus Eisenbacteria bacterium]|nr:DNA polymerase III subunit delta [Candidatus Eisenbacteria bacterium]